MAVGAAGIAVISLTTAGSASAAPNIQGFGTSEALIDGPMIKIYTPIDNVAVPNGLQPGARPAMTLPA